MEFSVRCECGVEHRVAKGAAGSTIACACGRLVAVPSLARLRVASGLSAVEVGPEERVPRLVSAGVLPGETCVRCGGRAAAPLFFRAICEREELLRPGRERSLSDANWLNVFLIPLGFYFFSWSSKEPTEADRRGRDTVVPLPLALCGDCGARFSAVRFNGLVPSLALGAAIGAGVLFAYPGAVAWAAVAAALAALFATRAFAGASRRELKTTLRAVPEYAELLDKYPEAELTRGF